MMNDKIYWEIKVKPENRKKEISIIHLEPCPVRRRGNNSNKTNKIAQKSQRG